MQDVQDVRSQICFNHVIKGLMKLQTLVVNFIHYDRMALAEPRHNKKLFSRIPTRCDTNRAVQEQKRDSGIELRIKEVQSL